MMSDLIDGTLMGWPVSILVERDAGGRAYGVHCCAYTNDKDESAPDAIVDLCDEISSDGSPARLIKRAIKLGFVADGV